MKLGLIGEKLGHSYSKMIHEEFRNEPYELWPLSMEEFTKFMEKKDFDGINVTIPYKQKVIPYLSYISESAKKIGAVNTILNKEGALYGYNTDYDGFLYLIQKHHIDVAQKTVCILGTGGTSKTAKCVLQDLGAKIIYKATIEDVDEDHLLSYDELKHHPEIQILVNTTPVGMYPKLGGKIIEMEWFPSLEAVVDVVYNPMRTQLILEGLKRNITSVSGLEMLVTQAKVANELFHQDQENSAISNSEIERIVRKIKKEVLNIVLIGLPGSGKSTVASLLKTTLQEKGMQMEVLECDEMIEKEEGCSIKEIFQTHGESYFRNLEEKLIGKVSLERNKIISTGGGVVLNPKNIDLLRGNGILIWLDRPLNQIIIDQEKRPLTRSLSDLEKQYQQRVNLYRSSCDMIIQNHSTLEETVKGIIGELKW